MSTDPIERLLADQKASGSYQGEDSFTISLQDALRKLAQHQLPERHDWVLKVVQAAVRGGSPELRITLEHGRLDFHFATPDWATEQLVKAVAHPGPDEDPALNHLVVALRALILHLKADFRLTLTNDQCLRWGKDSLLPRASERAGKDSGLTVWLAPTKKRLRSGHAEEFAEILQKLTRRACTCPIPLWADGRRVDSLFYWTEPESLWLPLASDPIEVPEVPLWTPPFNAPLAGQIEPWISRHYPTSKAIEATSQERTSVVAMLFAKFKKLSPRAPVPTTSALCWIQDGVIVQQDPLSYKYGLVCLVGFSSADGLETDLTGFQLRKTPQLQERRNKVLEALGTWLNSANLAQADEEPGGIPKALETLLLLLVPGGGWAAALLQWRDRRLLRSLREKFERGLDEIREQASVDLA